MISRSLARPDRWSRDTEHDTCRHRLARETPDQRPTTTYSAPTGLEEPGRRCTVPSLRDVHISHLADGHVDRVEDVVAEGDEVLVKCIDIDPTGRIRLSRKEALADAAAQAEQG